MHESRSFFDFDDAFRKIVYAQQSDPPSTFFHYTTAEGLKGIVESKAFWATHFQYTNDAEEVRYGIKLAIEECRNARADQTADDKQYDIHDYLSGSVPNSNPSDALLQIAVKTLETDPIEGRSRYEFFLACFSEEQDLLSQWRAYASDASGYSIGFYTEDLINDRIKSLLANGETLDLLQVKYEEEKQRDLIQKTIEMATKRFDEATSSVCGEHHREFMISSNLYLVASLLRLALHFKHPGFSEEKEWRLILSKTKPEICSTGDDKLPVRTRISQ